MGKKNLWDLNIAAHPQVKKLILLALQEDLGEAGDITSDSIIESSSFCRAEIIAKSTGILAGLPICEAVFKLIDDKVNVRPAINEGGAFKTGDRLIEVSGATSAIMAGERLALNFLQHLSGIATLTGQYVNECRGTKARIFDTRKTLPGLRLVEKYAVTVGGGYNHRFGLYDAVLIKDNHLAVAKSINGAVAKAKKRAPVEVEVEVEDLKQMSEALAADADIILLDNMDVKMMKKAVRLASGRAVLEASGGITLENAHVVAATGVDRISVGAITQGAKPLDIALNVIEVSGST